MRNQTLDLFADAHGDGVAREAIPELDALPDEADHTGLLSLLPHSIANSFRCMDIAEEVIAESKARSPSTADDVDQLFMALCPPSGMSRVAGKLYRHHAQEIVCRVEAAGHLDEKTLSHPTTAERLLVMSRVSAKVPLRRDAVVLYMRLFEQVFDTLPGAWTPPDPSYERAVDRLNEHLLNAADQMVKERMRSHRNRSKD